MTERSRLLLVRMAANGLVVILLIGLGVTVAMVVEAARPEPGANMVLMALPLIGGLMIVPAIGLMALSVAYRQVLYRWEVAAYLAVSFAWLAPGTALVLLG